MKKKELLIIALILILAGAVWGGMKYFGPDRYGKIKITCRGQDFGTYSLGKNQKITINGTNTCEIKDGQCRMIEAMCPDHLCIEFMPINEHGGLIVCLPNEVIIEGISADGASEPAVDIIAQ